MLALNIRCRDILMLLLQSRTPLASAEIAAELDITSRQVRYSLRDVKRWLEAKDIHLITKPGCGIFVDARDPVKEDLIRELERLTGYSLSLSPSERLHILIFSLLMSDQPLIAKQLGFQLGVSRTTVLKDMDKVERWLGEHELSLIRRPNFGFKVVGREREWREAVVDFILDTVGGLPLLAFCEGREAVFRARMKREVGLLRILDAFLKELELGYCRRLIDTMEGMLHRRFTDTVLASLTLHLSLMIKGAQQGRIIELPVAYAESLRRQVEFKVAKAIAEQVQPHFDLTLAESEVTYTAMQLLGAKKRRMVSEVIGEMNGEKMSQEALEIVDDILGKASAYLHPYLRVDQQLKHSLAFHVETALNRMRLGLPIRNPLLEEIRSQYPYILKVARRSSAILEEEVGRAIPEEEIGYIAMHLGAAMERLRPFPGVGEKVLVVCGEGVATTSLLVSRMQAEFPEVEVVEVMSVLEVSRRHTFRGDIDAIISTVPIKIAGIPIIVVNPLLDAKDKANIRKILNPRISIPRAPSRGSEAEQPSLVDLITTETTEVKIRVRSWQAAVDAAGGLLLNMGAIEARYIEAMKNLILRHGPYMVAWPGAVLLHAHPEKGVKELCMCLVTLRDAVNFGHPCHDPVDLVIGLGAIDKSTHLRALAQLSEILSNQGMISAIRNARDKKEVMELVREFLTSLSPRS